MPRLALQVALGVGAAGALVDVSDYVELGDVVGRAWGRNDQYYGTDAGEFSFVLNNADGRFTPENPLSPLATPLVEGAAVCLDVGGRLTAGTVRGVEAWFPEGEAAWSRVRVTCDDMLGLASRSQIENDDLYETAALRSAFAYWPMDDVEGSQSARELVDGTKLLRSSGLTFGVDGVPELAGTQAEVAAPTGESVDRLWFDQFTALGWTWWNFWVTPMTGEGFLELVDSGGQTIFGVRNGAFVRNAAGTFVAVAEPGRAYFVSVRGGSDPAVYIDGVLLYSATGVLVSPVDTKPRFEVGGASYGESRFRLSRISVSAERIAGERARRATSAHRLNLIEDAFSGIVLDSIPTAFTGPEIGGLRSSDTALDALNEVALTEQGHVYCVTTGTLTAPVETVKIRFRDRPVIVDCAFGVEDDLFRAPSFIRDLRNLVASARVRNGSSEVRVEDSSLFGRAGNAASVDDVMWADPIYLRAWGQDRIRRGADTRMQIASVVVDAMHTSSDRSADLLNLEPGDRVRFTGLPDSALGFTTWDGWFLGASESHSLTVHEFRLYFAPALPDVAVYDTNRFMADGELTLSAGVNDSATSFSVATTGARLSTEETPYVLQVGDEHMFVTACSSATPQMVTVERGYNGTTAAAHSSGALVDLADLRPFYSTGSVPYPSASVYPSVSVYPLGPASAWSLYAF